MNQTLRTLNITFYSMFGPENRQ